MNNTTVLTTLTIGKLRKSDKSNYKINVKYLRRGCKISIIFFICLNKIVERYMIVADIIRKYDIGTYVLVHKCCINGEFELPLSFDNNGNMIISVFYNKKENQIKYYNNDNLLADKCEMHKLTFFNSNNRTEIYFGVQYDKDINNVEIDIY